MLNRDPEIEVWSIFLSSLWYELNPRVRCAFGNVSNPGCTTSISACVSDFRQSPEIRQSSKIISWWCNLNIHLWVWIPLSVGSRSCLLQTGAVFCGDYSAISGRYYQQTELKPQRKTNLRSISLWIGMIREIGRVNLFQFILTFVSTCCESSR